MLKIKIVRVLVLGIKRGEIALEVGLNYQTNFRRETERDFYLLRSQPELRGYEIFFVILQIFDQLLGAVNVDKLIHFEASLVILKAIANQTHIINSSWDEQVIKVRF